MVYVISDCCGHVKIGVAKNPINRLKALQTGMPTKLVILACADWPNSYERRIHRVLHASRLQGEWFSAGTPTDSLAKHMQAGLPIDDWLRSLAPTPSRLARILRLAG